MPNRCCPGQISSALLVSVPSRHRLLVVRNCGLVDSGGDTIVGVGRGYLVLSLLPHGLASRAIPWSTYLKWATQRWNPSLSLSLSPLF